MLDKIDVQCRDDKLFVAENSRHRVVCYDREGKRVDAWEAAIATAKAAASAAVAIQ